MARSSRIVFWISIVFARELNINIPLLTLLNKMESLRNRTLIEAARTMLSDSKLPVLFWGEAMNTAYYVLNKV